MAEKSQPLYKDLSFGQTATKDLSFPRGDGYRYIYFDHPFTSAADISGARFVMENSSGTEVCVLSYENQSSQWSLVVEANRGRLILLSADTQDLDPDTYFYGIELWDQDDEAFTPVVGTINLFEDYADDDGTASYLSWDTRQDLTDILSGLASTHDFNYVDYDSTGATPASGETSITLVSAAVFSAGDTIRVELDDGTYQETTIASISGNTLTIDDALTDDVGLDNIVRQKV